MKRGSTTNEIKACIDILITDIPLDTLKLIVSHFFTLHLFDLNNNDNRGEVVHQSLKNNHDQGEVVIQPGDIFPRLKNKTQLAWKRSTTFLNFFSTCKLFFNYRIEWGQQISIFKLKQIHESLVDPDIHPKKIEKENLSVERDYLLSKLGNICEKVTATNYQKELNEAIEKDARLLMYPHRIGNVDIISNLKQFTFSVDSRENYVIINTVKSHISDSLNDDNEFNVSVLKRIVFEDLWEGNKDTKKKKRIQHLHYTQALRLIQLVVALTKNINDIERNIPIGEDSDDDLIQEILLPECVYESPSRTKRIELTHLICLLKDHGDSLELFLLQ